MIPSFSDYFRSMYYENTYLSPCDLNEKALSQHLFETEDVKLAETAQRLISTPEVQQVLSTPLTRDLEEEASRRRQILKSHQFGLLRSKPIPQTGRMARFYGVIEHNDLPGWIIKSGAIRIPEEEELVICSKNDRHEAAFFTAEDSILRIAMASRISRIAQESGIDIVVPKKKLVKYANVGSASTPNTTYCVISKKLDILSASDTVDRIKCMTEKKQRDVAQKICTIVQKAGFVDASFDNIRLTRDNKLAFIDTEPAGLMTVKKPGLWYKVFPPRGSSVEKCARIGLFTLLRQASRPMNRKARSMDYEPELQAFHEEVQSQYNKLVPPKLSKWKIVASIASLGIIIIINAIISLVAIIRIRKTFRKLLKIDMLYQSQSIAEYQSQPSAEQLRLQEQHQRDGSSIEKQLFSLIEGISYQA